MAAATVCLVNTTAPNRSSYCAQCGAAVPAGGAYCAGCGQPVEATETTGFAIAAPGHAQAIPDENNQRRPVASRPALAWTLWVAGALALALVLLALLLSAHSHYFRGYLGVVCLVLTLATAALTAVAGYLALSGRRPVTVGILTSLVALFLLSNLLSGEPLVGVIGVPLVGVAVWAWVTMHPKSLPGDDPALVGVHEGRRRPDQGARAQPETSTMAILAFVLVFFVGIAGLVLGYVALSDIRKSRGLKTGRGLALAAVIIGWAQVVLSVALITLLIVLAATTK